MRKEKMVFVVRRDPDLKGKEITAKREMSFGIQLATRLYLDQLTFEFNKNRLNEKINIAIDKDDREEFIHLSEQYKPYTWE